MPPVEVLDVADWPSADDDRIPARHVKSCEDPGCDGRTCHLAEAGRLWAVHEQEQREAARIPAPPVVRHGCRPVRVTAADCGVCDGTGLVGGLPCPSDRCAAGVVMPGG